MKISGEALCYACGGNHEPSGARLDCIRHWKLRALQAENKLLVHQIYERKPNDLEQTEELFDFLQGKLPEGCKIRRNGMPKLTPEQAWTVIWYLGNLYWKVTDHIERCELCGRLFDTHCEGTCLDYGKPPHHFCECCMASEEYGRKAQSRKLSKV